jgi:predicted secreted protein
MKMNLIFGLILLFPFFSGGQKVIQPDTVVTKNIGVHERFTFQFLEQPGSGYVWRLNSGYDSTLVSIRLLRQEPVKGTSKAGGKYVTTYEYTGKSRGTLVLEYLYGRPGLHEKQYKCDLRIIIK